MNLYLIALFLLAAGSLAERKYPEYEKRLYPFCWLVLTALLCLRFGQGTDYVTYHAIYDTIPVTVDLQHGYICGYYPEIGWRLVSAAFKLLHIPFQGFAFVLGLADMVLLHRFLEKYVPWKVAGLFLAYPVLYVVYMVSGLRQGLAICIFLGIALPYYLEKKWIPYTAAVILAMSFHKAGCAWFLLVIAAYVPMKVLFFLAGLSAAGGLVLQIQMVQELVLRLIPLYHMEQFLRGGSPSFFAVGERLVTFGVLAGLYCRKYRAEDKADPEVEAIMKACTCGLCIYMFLFGNAYYASRFAVIFKVLEIMPAVRLMEGRDRTARMAAVFFLSLTLLMGVKNLNAAVREGGYSRLGVHVLTYPYISLFRPERINDYFDYEEKRKEIYGYNIEDQILWIVEE